MTQLMALDPPLRTGTEGDWYEVGKGCKSSLAYKSHMWYK